MWVRCHHPAPTIEFLPTERSKIRSRRQARSCRVRSQISPGIDGGNGNIRTSRRSSGEKIFIECIRFYMVTGFPDSHDAGGSRFEDEKIIREIRVELSCHRIPSALRIFLLRRLQRTAFFPGSFFNVGGEGLKSLRFDLIKG